MLKAALSVLVFTISMLIPDACRAKVIDAHVYIVPAGDVDEGILNDIGRKIPDILPMSSRVEIDPRREMPEAAHNYTLGQYNVQAALEEIARRVTIDVRVDRALIITDDDLYMPDSDFVFGYADPRKGVVIISLARLREGLPDTAAGRKRLIDRAAKEASRQLGRSWDLGQCSDPKCVMHVPAAPADIDAKKPEFCRNCRKILHGWRNKSLFGSILP